VPPQRRFRWQSSRPSSTQVIVSLIDPNGQKVEQRSVATNSYGSADGEFTIPSGRLLGNLRIESSMNGRTDIRVEEYKRPTFDVTLSQPKSALRLNRPAKLTGEARYYRPPTNGSEWHAIREPVFPLRWSWYRWERGQENPQIVARTSAPGRRHVRDHVYGSRRWLAADSVETTHAYRQPTSSRGGETVRRPWDSGWPAPSKRTFGRRPAFSRDCRFGRNARTDLNGVPRAGEGTRGWSAAAARAHPSADLLVQFPAGWDPERKHIGGDLMRPPGSHTIRRHA
jgi:hypothetical protein